MNRRLFPAALRALSALLFTPAVQADDLKVIKAIYELSGDTLRVCYALDGSGRPTEFATKEGSAWLLVTYTREKKAQ